MWDCEECRVGMKRAYKEMLDVVEENNISIPTIFLISTAIKPKISAIHSILHSSQLPKCPNS
jgi:hypothetical protein